MHGNGSSELAVEAHTLVDDFSLSTVKVGQSSSDLDGHSFSPAQTDRAEAPQLSGQVVCELVMRRCCLLPSGTSSDLYFVAVAALAQHPNWQSLPACPVFSAALHDHSPHL